MVVVVASSRSSSSSHVDIYMYIIYMGITENGSLCGMDETRKSMSRANEIKLGLAWPGLAMIQQVRRNRRGAVGNELSLASVLSCAVCAVLCCDERTKRANEPSERTNQRTTVPSITTRVYSMKCNSTYKHIYFYGQASSFQRMIDLYVRVVFGNFLQ